MINKREINWNGNEGVNSLFNEWPFFSSHRKRDLLSLLFWLGLSSLVCQTLTIRRIRERRRSASLSPPHVDTISTPLSHWLGCGFPCCYHLCVYGRRWSRPKCGFLTNKFIGVGQFYDSNRNFVWLVKHTVIYIQSSKTLGFPRFRKGGQNSTCKNITNIYNRKEQQPKEKSMYKYWCINGEGWQIDSSKWLGDKFCTSFALEDFLIHPIDSQIKSHTIYLWRYF